MLTRVDSMPRPQAVVLVPVVIIMPFPMVEMGLVKVNGGGATVATGTERGSMLLHQIVDPW
jgi:hypothetical protein